MADVELGTARPSLLTKRLLNLNDETETGTSPQSQASPVTVYTPLKGAESDSLTERFSSEFRGSSETRGSKIRTHRMNMLSTVRSVSIAHQQKPHKSRHYEKAKHERGLSTKLRKDDRRNVTLFDLRRMGGEDVNSLSWYNVSIRTKRHGKPWARKDGELLLDGLTGKVKGGEMAAIMGPSGSGKTILLNVLAGRTGVMSTLSPYDGRIALNGVQVNSTIRKQSIAYVTQEDIFYPELTVMETFMFAAKLKLPHEKIENVKATVKDLIEDLDLKGTENIRIGNELKKGISGGQKRRLSIGLELIVEPDLIFLDEPTTGLDSTSARRVCTSLRQLTDNHNCIVLATIHQPSIETFELFKKVFFVRDGRCVYCESVGPKLYQVWKDMNDPIPDEENPADHCLESLQVKSDDEFDRMVRACYDRNSSYFDGIRSQINASAQFDSDIVDRLQDFANANHHNPFLMQIKQLCGRAIRRRLRSRGPLLSLIIMPLITLLLNGLLAQGVGKSDNPAELYSVWALVVAMMLLISFNSNNSVGLNIPAETPIRRRELQSHLYTPTCYILSKCFVDLPFLGILFTLGFLPMYFFVPFNAPFYYLVWVIIGHVWVSISVAWCVSVFVSSQAAALQYLGVIFNPQLLFVGLLVPVRLMPKWLKWANYACFMKYSVNIFAILEFEFSASSRNDRYQASSAAFLDLQLVDPDWFWYYVLILVSIFLSCVVISIVVLHRRNIGDAKDEGIGMQVMTKLCNEQAAQKLPPLQEENETIEEVLTFQTETVTPSRTTPSVQVTNRESDYDTNTESHL